MLSDCPTVLDVRVKVAMRYKIFFNQIVLVSCEDGQKVTDAEIAPVGGMYMFVQKAQQEKNSAKKWLMIIQLHCKAGDQYTTNRAKEALNESGFAQEALQIFVRMNGAFMNPCAPEVLKILIEARANVNLKAKDNGNTPLIEVCYQRQEMLIPALLDVKADINSRNDQGETPLIVAVMLNFRDIIQALIHNGTEYCQLDLRDNSRNTALLYACFNKTDDLVLKLLRAKANPNIRCSNSDTAITVAACEESDRSVRELLDCKADPNMGNDLGKSALTYGITRGNAFMVRMLLMYGAVVRTGNDQMSPLLLAAQRNSLDVVELLLLHQCDINDRDNNGSTPLMYAVANGMEDMVETLVKFDADASIRNYAGQDALELAIELGDENILRMLKKSLGEDHDDAYAGNQDAKKMNRRNLFAALISNPNRERPHTHRRGEQTVLGFRKTIVGKNKSVMNFKGFEHGHHPGQYFQSDTHSVMDNRRSDIMSNAGEDYDGRSQKRPTSGGRRSVPGSKDGSDQFDSRRKSKNTATGGHNKRMSVAYVPPKQILPADDSHSGPSYKSEEPFSSGGPGSKDNSFGISQQADRMARMNLRNKFAGVAASRSLAGLRKGPGVGGGVAPRQTLSMAPGALIAQVSGNSRFKGGVSMSLGGNRQKMGGLPLVGENQVTQFNNSLPVAEEEEEDELASLIEETKRPQKSTANRMNKLPEIIDEEDEFNQSLPSFHASPSPPVEKGKQVKIGEATSYGTLPDKPNAVDENQEKKNKSKFGRDPRSSVSEDSDDSLAKMQQDFRANALLTEKGPTFTTIPSIIEPEDLNSKTIADLDVLQASLTVSDHQSARDVSSGTVPQQRKVTLAEDTNFASETFSDGGPSAAQTAQNKRAIRSITMRENDDEDDSSYENHTTSRSTSGGGDDRRVKNCATIQPDRSFQTNASKSFNKHVAAATLLNMAAILLFGEDPSMNRHAPRGMTQEDFELGMILNNQQRIVEEDEDSDKLTDERKSDNDEIDDNDINKNDNASVPLDKSKEDTIKDDDEPVATISMVLERKKKEVIKHSGTVSMPPNNQFQPRKSKKTSNNDGLSDMASIELSPSKREMLGQLRTRQFGGSGTGSNTINSRSMKSGMSKMFSKKKNMSSSLVKSTEFNSVSKALERKNAINQRLLSSQKEDDGQKDNNALLNGSLFNFEKITTDESKSMNKKKSGIVPPVKVNNNSNKHAQITTKRTNSINSRVASDSTKSPIEPGRGSGREKNTNRGSGIKDEDDNIPTTSPPVSLSIPDISQKKKTGRDYSFKSNGQRQNSFNTLSVPENEVKESSSSSQWRHNNLQDVDEDLLHVDDDAPPSASQLLFEAAERLFGGDDEPRMPSDFSLHVFDEDNDNEENPRRTLIAPHSLPDSERNHKVGCGSIQLNGELININDNDTTQSDHKKLRDSDRSIISITKISSNNSHTSKDISNKKLNGPSEVLRSSQNTNNNSQISRNNSNNSTSANETYNKRKSSSLHNRRSRIRHSRKVDVKDELLDLIDDKMDGKIEGKNIISSRASDYNTDLLNHHGRPSKVKQSFERVSEYHQRLSMNRQSVLSTSNRKISSVFNEHVQARKSHLTAITSIASVDSANSPTTSLLSPHEKYGRNTSFHAPEVSSIIEEKRLSNVSPMSIERNDILKSLAEGTRKNNFITKKRSMTSYDLEDNKNRRESNLETNRHGLLNSILKGNTHAPEFNIKDSDEFVDDNLDNMSVKRASEKNIKKKAFGIDTLEDRIAANRKKLDKMNKKHKNKEPSKKKATVATDKGSPQSNYPSQANNVNSRTLEFVKEEDDEKTTNPSLFKSQPNFRITMQSVDEKDTVSTLAPKLLNQSSRARSLYIENPEDEKIRTKKVSQQVNFKKMASTINREGEKKKVPYRNFHSSGTKKLPSSSEEDNA